MKPRTLRYQTFAEIADEMAKKRHGGLWRAYRNNYLSNLARDSWGGRFPDDGKQSRLFYLSAGGEPEPITREVLWRLLGIPNRPLNVREVLEVAGAPCEVLAETELEEYGVGAVLVFENLALLEADAHAWAQEYCEKHPSNVGERKHTAILDAFNKMCEKREVSFKRGGLAQAADALTKLFPSYQVDTIRKKIQRNYQDTKKQHERDQTAREK